ncbi:MAG: zinc-dependent metalloprotease [Bacteroidia bacterium]|nr:zinc-dependent metalloprotease [Bacteroidia bacterium]
MKKLFFICVPFLILAGCVSSKNKKHTVITPPAAKTTTIADKIKSCKKLEGLFPLYQDTASGNVFVLLKKEQINKQYIYFSYTVDGVVAAGHFRGSFRDNKLFTIKRYFDKIEFTVLNTGFYFDPANPISKSAAANISNATLTSQKIIAEDFKKGEILLDGNSLFLSEIFSQIKPSVIPGAGVAQFSLGSLSKDKTKFISLRNYEKNTDIIVEYVYDNPAPVIGGGKEVTDERSVSITVQHTLIEAPQNNFKPRFDDPRIGYFSEEVDDMTTTNTVDYRDVIHRWNLVKKDSLAALSDPVEPIVWWIENTTPVEFRATIKEAGEKWNLAFEKAGFKNAVVINEQSDTATWDAGDIRYNVLRWTSSPQPPFGGYGPSFVDPRTGQILGADIMLEYIFITNRIRQEEFFGAVSAMPTPLPKRFNNYCDANDYLHQTTLFGNQVLESKGINEVEKRDYLKQSLYYLVLHEMGHTMGLNHNMKASQMLKPAQINNKILTRQIGLTASVMDYPAANVALDKKQQGDYFTTRPGPYDLWAIEFGYTPELADANNEKQRVHTLLARSNDSTLIFGNDADDMRGFGGGIDPRINVNDLSGDAITYGIERVQLSTQLMGGLKEKYTKPNQSYQELRQAYGIAQSEYYSALNVISRYIGGVYVNRTFIGDPGAGKAYTPVSIADQKRAMAALSRYAFSANAFGVQNDLYPYLQNQRRGFGFFGNNEDPKIHDRVLAYQRNLMTHLLHPGVLKRLSDTRMYGNTYTVLMMMNDLTGGCFKGETGNIATIRQNLQLMYVERMIGIVKSPAYDAISQGAALAQLNQIKLMPGAGNDESKAHMANLKLKIEKAFEN